MHFVGAILIGEIGRGAQEWCLLERLVIGEREGLAGRRHSCALVLACGRGNGVERVRFEGVGEAAIMRRNVANVLESALLVRLPHVKCTMAKRSFDRGRHVGWPLAVNGFDDHAPIVPVGRGERDIAAGGKLS